MAASWAAILLQAHDSELVVFRCLLQQHRLEAIEVVLRVVFSDSEWGAIICLRKYAFASFSCIGSVYFESLCNAGFAMRLAMGAS